MKKQLLIGSILLGLLILGSCNEVEKKEETSKKSPNLLVIMTDEHNFRTLGCYRDLLSAEQAFVWGDRLAVKTPNIDFLADNGTLFSKFYAVAPLCSPARSSFVSGLYPQHTGVTENDLPMRDTVVTFAEILKENGYATGFAGKWHLDGMGKPQWAPERRFGFSDNRYMFNRGHWKKIIDSPDGPLIDAVNAKGDFTYALNGADETSYMTDFLTDKTLEFIKENKEAPFCYMVSYPDPHGPDEVRAPYDTLYNHMAFAPPKTSLKEGNNIPSWASKQEPEVDQSQYFGMVKCIDDNVGRLIDYLKESELLQNTIIVFTADHGDLRGEHQRRNKGVPMEGSAKVPFIVYSQDLVQKGATIKNVFNSVDFAPSILNMMGFSSDEDMQGIDFSSLLTAPDLEEGFEDFTVTRSSSKKEKWISGMTSRYKLVLSELDPPWLLDLEVNPDETINYIEMPEKEEIVKNLAVMLSDYGHQFEDPYLKHPKIAEDLSILHNQ